MRMGICKKHGKWARRRAQADQYRSAGREPGRYARRNQAKREARALPKVFAPAVPSGCRLDKDPNEYRFPNPLLLFATTLLQTNPCDGCYMQCDCRNKIDQ
jgi:hypothetical protein